MLSHRLLSPPQFVYNPPTPFRPPDNPIGKRVTIELDLFIDAYAQILEGYLTRVQLLDILV